MFELTQERIDLIKKAARYLKTIDDFSDFVTKNQILDLFNKESKISR